MKVLLFLTLISMVQTAYSYSRSTKVNIASLDEFAKEEKESLIGLEDEISVLNEKYPHIQFMDPRKVVTKVMISQKSSCFGSKFKVDTPKKAESLETQISEVFDFIEEYYMAMKGRQDYIFPIHKISICARGQLQYDHKDYDYTSGHLTIYLKNKNSVLGRYYETVDSFQLMDDLKSGHMFGHEDDMVWMLLNPLGFVQNNLRKYILRLVNKEIEKVVSNPEASLEHIQSVRPDLTLEEIELKLKSKDVTSYLIDQFFNTFLSKSIADNPTVNLEIVQNGGLVNVGNYHRINIDLVNQNISAELRPLNGTPTTVQATDEYDIQQTGIINVYTIDDISISAPVNFEFKSQGSFLNILISLLF